MLKKSIKLALLFCCLLFGSVVFGQYNGSITQGSIDGTPYLATVNLWKLLPGGGVCQTGTLKVGTDGSLWCIGTDSPSHIYLYNQSTPGWYQQTAMGTASVNLAVLNASTVYSLQTTAHCTLTGNGYGIFKWTGSAWTQPHSQSCLTVLNVNSDGVLFGSTTLGTQQYGGTAWTSNDAGASYTQMGAGTSWAYIGTGIRNGACGITNNQVNVWTADTNTWSALSTQPNNSDTGITGCVMANASKTISPQIYIWGPARCPTCGQVYVQRYDIVAGAWSGIAGGSFPSGVSAGSTLNVFSLDANGHPYHLNLLPGYIANTVAGAAQCLSGTTCTSSSYHAGQSAVAFPHGYISGGNWQNNIQAQNGPYPNFTISNLYAQDWSPACDPFWGDPADPECQGLSMSSVICSVSQHQFVSGGGSPVAVNRPSGVSYDSLSYNGQNLNNVTYQLGLKWVSMIVGGIQNTCLPGTTSYCRGKDINDVMLGIGAGSTPTEAETAAQNRLNDLLPTHTPGAIRVTYIYDPAKGPSSCQNTDSFDAAPYLACR